MEVELVRLSNKEFPKSAQKFFRAWCSYVYGGRHPYDVVHLKGQSKVDVFKHLNSGIIIRPKPIRINYHQMPKLVFDELILLNKRRYYWRLK